MLKHVGIPAPGTSTKDDDEERDTHNDGRSKTGHNIEQRVAREHLLAKIHDLHSVLDGLSSHGTHLHQMVSSFYKFNTSAINHNSNTTNHYSKNTITSSPDPFIPPPSPPSPDVPDIATITSGDQDKEIQSVAHQIDDVVYDGDALVELGHLKTLLSSSLWIDFGNGDLICSGTR